MEHEVRRNGVAGVVLLALTLLAPMATAQVVNAEALTRDTEGFAFQLVGSLTLRRGNTTVTDVGGSGHAQYQTLYPELPSTNPTTEGTVESVDSSDDTPPFVRHRAFANSGARYASNADETIISQSFAHLRWTAMWIRRLGSELFAQHQYNEFQRLQARVLLGAGARALLVHTAPFRLAVGSGYMAEYERLTPEASAGDDHETLAHRWTNFVNARLALFDEDRLVIENTVYIQPRFDDFSDHRILEQLGLDVSVTKVLTLGTALTVAHDSRPPTGVEPTDLTLVQTVKLVF